MCSKQGWRQFWVILLTCVTLSAFADTPDNPCSGPNSFLEVINRPTFADSPCTVPNKKFVFEFGYQYLNLIEGVQGQSYPFPELRYGLPGNNEIFVLFPDYIHLSTTPSSGFSEMFAGFKHVLFYNRKMIATVDASVIPSSGSRAFGSKGWGGVINGIFNFSMSEKFSFTSQLGFSTLTQSVLAGGKRYNSVNSDALISWYLSDKFEVYAEIYGASKTAPDEGSGFNAAIGMIYLLTQNMTIDLEGGQRLRGFFGNIENYVGAGAAIQF